MIRAHDPVAIWASDCFFIGEKDIGAVEEIFREFRKAAADAAA